MTARTQMMVVVASSLLPTGSESNHGHFESFWRQILFKHFNLLDSKSLLNSCTFDLSFHFFFKFTVDLKITKVSLSNLASSIQSTST